MKTILICVLVLSLWLMASAGLIYARSTASAAYIVCAVAQFKTPENASEVDKVGARVARELKGIREPYVSLAYGGGASGILSVLGLVANRKRRMSNQAPEDTARKLADPQR